MYTFPMFRRQDDRPTTRRPEARRRSPLVESLEGRQLLSTLTFTKIEMNVSAIVGQHIGTNVAGTAARLMRRCAHHANSTNAPMENASDGSRMRSGLGASRASGARIR